MKKNIVLVGFMGTGKTSVGKALARRLNRPVVDVDHTIEENEKRKISEIFEKEGEARFRELEKEAIRILSQREGIIITTGGGAVIEPENRERLENSGWTVALMATPETIYQRVKDSRHRPLLENKDRLAEIKILLETRKPFYEKSDFQFETDGKNAAQVAEAILEALKGKI